MTDLERFFRRLVHNLAEVDLARLRQPVPIGEIYGSIVPYRTHRRALALDTSEDYELVLMRLCAGEDGFAAASPEEVRARFQQELASPNPDLGLLYEFGEALLSLAPSRISAALAEPESKPEVEPRRHQPVAPPASEAAQPAESTPPTASAPPAAPRCVACGEALPQDPPAKFCPYCGKSQSPPSCSACGLELEPGWRFCPGCGQGT